MTEQVETLLETINVGLAPIMESVSELTGYSNTFIKENFDTVFYKAGQYLFWKDIIGGFQVGFVCALIAGFFTLIITIDEMNNRKCAAWTVGIFLATFLIIFGLAESGNIILYNTAREAWILENLSYYIK